MATLQLHDLLTRESEQVEWKEDVADWRDVVKTCVAFANDIGNLGRGYVVCGARETRDAHGFPDVEPIGLTSARFKEVEGRVLDACQKLVSPPIVPQVIEQPVSEERRLLIFTVPATRNPHAYRADPTDSGAYYIRRGRSTVMARNGLLLQLFERKGTVPPWDERSQPKASVDDIDMSAARELLRRMGMPPRTAEQLLGERLSPLAPSLSELESLTRMLRPTNAALLMFGAEPQRYVGSAVVVVSIYPGTDRSEPHMERHELIGTIFEQERRIRELFHAQSFGIIDKTRAEANVQKYSEQAFREAVVNALVHRDYEDREPVRITFFDDRIEILSPGALPRGVDSERFIAGVADPRWRNRSLAFFCYRLDLAQAEGQGIRTIMRSMKEGGYPEPSFRIGEVTVTCVLPAHARHGLARAVLEAERSLLARDFNGAEQRLQQALAGNPHDERALRLLCDVYLLSRRPERLWEVIRQRGIQVESLSAANQIAFAEVLGAATGDPEIEVYWQRLVDRAIRGPLQWADLRRLMTSIRARGLPARALQLLDQMLAEGMVAQDPTGSPGDVALLRGQTLVEVARRCEETATASASSEVGRRAQELGRQYLEEAREEFRRAMGLTTDPVQARAIQRELDELPRPSRRSRPG